VFVSNVVIVIVATLALGSRPRKKGLKGAGQEECEKEDSHSQVSFPFWELESRWTFERSESNFRGRNTSHWGVIYTIGKLLKCRCLKWARMTYWDICNTSYGKKKGRPQKVGNRLDFHVCRWSAIHRWKALDESYNFALNFIPIKGLSKKLWPRKVAGVQP